jgi:hypothetical protein
MQNASRPALRMTVADLMALIADLPEWAVVEVVSYDDEGCSSTATPLIDYGRGVLTIDAA